MIQKNFAGFDLHLWSFSKKNASYGVERKPIARLFREWDLYTIVGTDGSRDRSPEADLSKIESRAGPIIERIIRDARQGRLASLTQSDRQALATLVISQLRRSPDNFSASMLRLDIDADIARSIKQIEDAGRRLTDEAYEDVASGRLASRLRQNLMALGAPQPLDRASAAVLQRGFSVGVAEPNRSFILGSSPVVRFLGSLTRRNGLVDPTAEAWLPIARDVALCSVNTRQTEEILHISDTGVRNINNAIVSQSNVIASASRDLVASFARRFARITGRR